MGNEFDTDVNYAQYGSQRQAMLTIVLNKDTFYHGDNITGTIQLNLLTYFQLSDILLSLKVNEGWVNHTNKDYPQSDTNEIIIRTINLNLRGMLKVTTPFINLPPGMHSFPFAFPLPLVQPSFELSMKECKGFIRYLLGVSTESMQIQSNQKHIVIYSRVTPLMSPLTLTNEVKVTHMLFLDKGSVSLNASIEKNNFAYGETIPISVYIDNTKGMLDTKQVKICLSKHFRFHKKNSTKEDGIERVMHSEYFPFDCKKSSKKTLKCDFKIVEDDIDEFVYHQTFNSYPPSVTPVMLMHSVNNGIFRCYYEVKVTGYFTSFVSYSSRPRVKLNIAIVHDSKTFNQVSNVLYNPQMNNLNPIPNVFPGVAQSMIPQQPNYPLPMINPQQPPMQHINSNYQQPNKIVAMSQLQSPCYIKNDESIPKPIGNYTDSNANNNTYSNEQYQNINEVKDDGCPMASHLSVPMNSNDNNNISNHYNNNNNGNSNNHLNDNNYQVNDYPEPN